MLKHEVVDATAFNKDLVLPFELRLKDFEIAMQDVYDFFFDVNTLFLKKGLPRLDDEIRPAIMSGMLSDMLTASLAKHSRTLTQNIYFNGHPDLIVRVDIPITKSRPEQMASRSRRRGKRAELSIRTERGINGCAPSYMRPTTLRSRPKSGGR
jgi:hypothetical protein